MKEKTEEMKANILVPIDFTDAAKNAVNHAAKTAEETKLEMNLVHMCASRKEISEAKEELAKLIAEVETTAKINGVVRVGSFKDIPVVAKELDSEIVFMGTHGATGMQRILGSNALKLVTNSKLPFVIVQKDSVIDKAEGYKKILVTASSNDESKQKIKAVAEMAKYFDSEVILLYRNEKDENLRINASTNLVFMKKHLDQEGISYEVALSSGKNFNEDTIELAKKKGVDLIAIVNVQMNTILGTGLFGPNYEQELIMNDGNIPIMILSPSQNSNFANTVLS